MGDLVVVACLSTGAVESDGCALERDRAAGPITLGAPPRPSNQVGCWCFMIGCFVGPVAVAILIEFLL